MCHLQLINSNNNNLLQLLLFITLLSLRTITIVQYIFITKIFKPKLFSSDATYLHTRLIEIFLNCRCLQGSQNRLRSIEFEKLFTKKNCENSQNFRQKSVERESCRRNIFIFFSQLSALMKPLGGACLCLCEIFINVNKLLGVLLLPVYLFIRLFFLLHFVVANLFFYPPSFILRCCCYIFVYSLIM